MKIKTCTLISALLLASPALAEQADTKPKASPSERAEREVVDRQELLKRRYDRDKSLENWPPHFSYLDVDCAVTEIKASTFFVWIGCKPWYFEDENIVHKFVGGQVWRCMVTDHLTCGENQNFNEATMNALAVGAGASGRKLLLRTRPAGRSDTTPNLQPGDFTISKMALHFD